MRLKPVAASADVGFDRHVELYGMLHLLDDQRLDRVKLGQGHFKHQLVMHLQAASGL